MTYDFIAPSGAQAVIQIECEGDEYTASGEWLCPATPEDMAACIDFCCARVAEFIGLGADDVLLMLGAEGDTMGECCRKLDQVVHPNKYDAGRN